MENNSRFYKPFLHLLFQVKSMVERLTALVYQRCIGSLYEEHRLLFATLLCLNIQEESTQFTEEELSLLLQGLCLIAFWFEPRVDGANWP